jgi:GNAT superfamily N-acetyltransferase
MDGNYAQRSSRRRPRTVTAVPQSHETDVSIRPATVDDATALARLRWEWAGGAGDFAAFADDFRTWMRACQRSHTAFLAERDGTAVGMAWLAVVERVPEAGALRRRGGDLQTMYVTADLRGCGVGRRLVEAVVAAARADGLAHLQVRSGRRALGFYRCLGFDDTGHVLVRSVA